MPYIDQEARKRLAEEPIAETAGETNYLITLLMHKYFSKYYSVNKIAELIEYAIADLIVDGTMVPDRDCVFYDKLYDVIMSTGMDVSIGDCVGAMRCAFMEFYIMKVRPYEDTKIEENGPV